MHADTDDNTTLREQLSHVYWIGGASGAGKSTVARRIAAEHGLRLYCTDDVMPDHAKRSTPADAPYLQQFAAMDMDQRWVNRSPETMLETFHWFRGEGFGLIVEDLLGLPQTPGIVVEGFRLLPHLVGPLLADPANAIWLLPTPQFRESVFARRGPEWSFLPKTSDPAKALSNVLERDALFTSQLREQIAQLGLAAITVDTSLTEDDLVKQVTSALRL